LEGRKGDRRTIKFSSEAICPGTKSKSSQEETPSSALLSRGLCSFTASIRAVRFNMLYSLKINEREVFPIQIQKDPDKKNLGRVF
jgi:hypothetical protein